MFQAVPPPIIRSSKLYTQHRVFVELFLLITAIVSEFQMSSILILHASCRQTCITCTSAECTVENS